MTHDEVQAWLDRYVEAWRSYDPARIGELFAEDAEYTYHPWEEPIRGRAAIVESWLKEPDAAGSWRASYFPVAVDGSVAVSRGISAYLGGDGSVARIFDNLWLLRFDAAGRCREFTEFFMQRPSAD